jgi:predicted nucleic acid-binding protein
VTPPRRVVLDTDVLFSRVYHETYGRLGAERVVVVVWSEAILAELERVLRRHERSAAYAAAVCGFVRAGFPDSRIETADDVGRALVDDPADAHVAAAAITGGVEAIATHNRRDYREDALSSRGIAVIDPVEHLTSIAAHYPAEAQAALARQAAATRPQRTLAQLLDLFRALGHEALADGLGEAVLE